MIFQMLFILFSIYLWAVVLHELGHILFFIMVMGKYPDVRISTKPLSLKVGYPLDYINMDKVDLIIVNLSGIIWGVMPLTFVGFFFSPPYLIFISLMIVYLLGCKGDIGRIIKLIKSKH